MHNAALSQAHMVVSGRPPFLLYIEAQFDVKFKYLNIVNALQIRFTLEHW